MDFESIVTLLAIFTTAFASHPTTTPSLQFSTATATGPHFLPTYPNTITIASAQASTVEIALNSVISTWITAVSYTQLESEVFLAAPTDAQLSLAVNGYSWDAIIHQTWYQAGVSAQWRDMIDAQETAMQEAVDEVLGVKSEGLRLADVGVAVVLAGMGVMVIILL